MANLTLFVYVIGLERPFPVDIKRSQTVGHLKKAILKENPHDLKDIDARHLDLYKVDIPYDNDFKESVSQAFREKKEELDDPFDTLSEIFPQKPRAKVVSILVEIPVISE
jgi:Crinkler effector protein N-terminal domain